MLVFLASITVMVLNCGCDRSYGYITIIAIAKNYEKMWLIQLQLLLGCHCGGQHNSNTIVVIAVMNHNLEP